MGAVISLLPSRAQNQRGVQHTVLWTNITTPKPYHSIQMQFKTLRLGFTNKLIGCYIPITERICDPKTSECYPRSMTGSCSSILTQYWARSFWASGIQSLKTFFGLHKNSFLICTNNIVSFEGVSVLHLSACVNPVLHIYIYALKSSFVLNLDLNFQAPEPIFFYPGHSARVSGCTNSYLLRNTLKSMLSHKARLN